MSDVTKQSNPKDLLGTHRPPLSCVPCGPLFQVGAVLLEGACKYGRHNWRTVGVRSSIYYDAMQRHLMRWYEGHDLDRDSGAHHLAHVAACCLIVLDSIGIGNLNDDRPPATDDPVDAVWNQVKDVLSRYEKGE